MTEQKNPFSEHLEDILAVNDLKLYFPVYKGLLKRQVASVKAVDGVTFRVRRGRTFGIVGESGSGKTTVGHCLLANYKPTAGEVAFEGTRLNDMTRKGILKLRKTLQMVTQDPFASLDPRMTVRDIIGEGIRIHKVFKGRDSIDGRIREMLDLVGLSDDILTRYPHEFSGGQRQRISIARALAVQPSFVICDEVVSALDVSIQAQIVKLLMHLQDSLGLTYVFIGHDLAVVRHISDTVAVMYLGKFMEMTDSDELYTKPLHPYTKALISAAPIPSPKIDRSRERILLSGEIPSSINPPEGCNFCTRCPIADERCMAEEPEISEVARGHFVACHKI
jgi:oligopeptide transport system ATP-binding protein